MGLIGGAFSAIVKFGWEVPFPPRTPGIRSETNPPQAMLEWFGMSHETSHAMVSFNNNQLPIMSFAAATAFAGSPASSAIVSSIFRPLTAFVPFVAYASPYRRPWMYWAPYAARSPVRE